MDLDLQIPGALLSLCTHSRRCACPDSLSVCVLSRSGVSDFLRPQWIITRQAPLSMGFPRQEYWNGLPFPPPEDLPDPGMEPTSPASPASAGGLSTTEAPGRPHSLSGQEDPPGPGLLALRFSLCLSLCLRRLCSVSQPVTPAICVSGAQLVQKLLTSDWIQQMANPDKRLRCRRKD